MWNISIKNKNKQIDTENRLSVGRSRGWAKWVKRVKRYKLPK